MSQKTFMTIFYMNENRSLWRKVSFSHEQKYKRMRMHFCKMCIQCGNERRYLMQAIEHSAHTILVIFLIFFPFPGPNSVRFNVAYDVNAVIIWILRNNIILTLFIQVFFIYANNNNIYTNVYMLGLHPYFAMRNSTVNSLKRYF